MTTGTDGRRAGGEAAGGLRGFRERVVQYFRRVFRAEPMPQAAQALPYPVVQRFMMPIENGGPVLLVQPEDFRRRQPEPEANRDNATGGGSRDQVEMGENRVL